MLAAFAAGCGKEDEGAQIPSASAQQMIGLLDETDRRMRAANACGDVRDEDLPGLERQLNDLPGDTDENTRKTLEDGFAHLSELVDRECGRLQEEKERTTETETDTTPTIEPPPPPTETQPTETAPPTTAPTTPEPPDDDGSGGQQFPDGGGGGARPNGQGPPGRRDGD